MKYIITIIGIMLGSISGSADVFAQTITFAPVREGDRFVRVDVVVSSTESINAIEGVVHSSRAPEAVITGNSLIPFWIQSPDITGNHISFSGIIPGGFSGSGTVFSFLIPFGKETMISFDSGQVFKNDGLGTSIILSGKTVTLSKEVQENLFTVESVLDTSAPEPFIPEFITDASVLNNRFGISFATQDKQSGVAYYQIKRYPYTFLRPFIPWKKTQETFIPLSRLYRFMHIEIRAVDRAENIRTVTMSRTQKFSFYEFIVLIIVSGILIIIIARKVYK